MQLWLWSFCRISLKNMKIYTVCLSGSSLPSWVNLITNAKLAAYPTCENVKHQPYYSEAIFSWLSWHSNKHWSAGLFFWIPNSVLSFSFFLFDHLFHKMIWHEAHARSIWKLTRHTQRYSIHFVLCQFNAQNDNLLSWCDQASVNIFKIMRRLSSCTFFNLDLATVSRLARWICCQLSAPSQRPAFSFLDMRASFKRSPQLLILSCVSWSFQSFWTPLA